MIILQEPAQPLAAANLGSAGRVRVWDDQRVPEPLMGPLSMVVRHVLAEGAERPALPEQDQAVRTLLPDRAHEPVGVGVGIGRLDKRVYDLNSRALEDAAGCFRFLGATWISCTRYSMISCWWRLTKPARVASSSRTGGGRLARADSSVPRTGLCTGLSSAEYSAHTGAAANGPP